MKNHAPFIAESIDVMKFTSDALDDIEKIRIMQENRLRTMTDEIKNLNSVDHPSMNVARMTTQQLIGMESDLIKELNRQLKQSPFADFVKSRVGVGEKQLARLITEIHDPFWRNEDIFNTSDETLTTRDSRTIAPGEVSFPAGPRSVTQLWSYCGLANTETGEPVRRTRGVRSNWNQDAKTRAWLIVDSCFKQLSPACRATSETSIKSHTESCACSPYRVIIDNRRAETALSHPEWSPGHALADAKRIAMRELLKDLWRFSRDIHVENGYVLDNNQLIAQQHETNQGEAHV